MISWKAPFGYRRIPRAGEIAAHLEIYEPEAVVVRRIFDDRVAGGHSVREIVRRLNAEGILSPSGQSVWSTSSISNLLRNETYIGRLYYNQTEATAGPGGKSRQRPRPKEEWIAITVPAVVDDTTFEAAQRVGGRNAYFSPRRAKPGAFLLRGLVRCGHCGIVVACHQRPASKKSDAVWNRYYYCRNHDPIRAGGEDRRCPERNIRADALDEFVFNQIRDALLRPEVLLAGERAVTARTPAPDDQILAQQLDRLERKTEGALSEQRRLVDLYQADLIDLAELRRRTGEVDQRRRALEDQRRTLIEQRQTLTHDNQLRTRIASFAERVVDALEELDFDQRQALLRLVVEEVRVSGCDVQIRMGIPLDDGLSDEPAPTRSRGQVGVSSEDRLRSLGSRRG